MAIVKGLTMQDLMQQQAYTDYQRAAAANQSYQLEEQQRIKQALPAIMEQVQGMPPRQAMSVLIQKGIPANVAVNIAESLSKAQQREAMSSMLQSVSGGGSGMADKLAMMQAMQGDPSAIISRLDRKAETQIPGFKVKEGANPRPQDAEEVRTAALSAQKIARLGSQLKDLVKKHGFQPGINVPVLNKAIGSKEYRTMNRLYKAIQLEQKNLDDLGALVGADFQFITQAPDPTSILESESYGSPEEYSAQMDEYLNTVGQSASEVAKMYNYEPLNAEKTEEEIDPELLRAARERGLLND